MNRIADKISGCMEELVHDKSMRCAGGWKSETD